MISAAALFLGMIAGSFVNPQNRKVALGGASHRNAEAFAREFGEIPAELYVEGCART